MSGSPANGRSAATELALLFCHTGILNREGSAPRPMSYWCGRGGTILAVGQYLGRTRLRNFIVLRQSRSEPLSESGLHAATHYLCIVFVFWTDLAYRRISRKIASPFRVFLAFGYCLLDVGSPGQNELQQV